MTEPGIDGYFSNDDERMNFLSYAGAGSSVAIRHEDGRITRNVAPVSLGDLENDSYRVATGELAGQISQYPQGSAASTGPDDQVRRLIRPIMLMGGR